MEPKQPNDFSQVDFEALREHIKEMTGAVGIALVLSDSQLPCPDSRAGVKCPHPHNFVVDTYGISIQYAVEALTHDNGKDKDNDNE
jgi:hypothetical protein